MPHSSTMTPAGPSVVLEKVLHNNSDLQAVLGEVLSAERKDGLSNQVLRISAQKGVFFLRIGEAGSEALVDRFAEAHNLQLAAGLGVAVPSVYMDPDRGLLLTRALETRQSEKKDLPEMLGQELARLHNSKLKFEGEINPHTTYAALRRRISETLDSNPDLSLSKDVSAVLPDLDRLMADAGLQSQLVLVPSHGDLSEGNCLLADNRLWVIDWEFSGMASPCWDLAYAIQEIGFDAEAERRFLTAYESGQHRPIDRAALEVMKARCDAISALWAVVQLLDRRDPATFAPFALERAARALKQKPV
ncbi:phosphotransferase [Roseibium sp.]|uniref:phosphotransferase n=1 Tax=Roseibium sp. TaxID=1936156 RepID=UPI00391B97E2